MARGWEALMFGSKHAQRRRAKRQADRVLADARTAAETARNALRESRLTSVGRPPSDEELADAVQAAILGSILPYVKNAGEHTKRDRRGSGSGAVALLVGIAIGVGVAAWARSENDEESDVAEDDEWELANASSTRALKSTINETLDKADVVIQNATRKMAHTIGSAVGTVADAAGPTAERVTGKLKVARSRATEEVIRTLDGMEDVWDDESDDSSHPIVQRVPKKPVPRKPVEGKPKPSTTSKGVSNRSRTPGTHK